MHLYSYGYFLIGIVFLTLAKLKNVLKGYSTPKTFDIKETQRCIEYDIRIVDNWLSHLKSYAGSNYSLIGKNVLELGPGSDLGVGIYLLHNKCLKYNACDVNDLVKKTPDEFYEKLFENLEKVSDNNCNEISLLRKEMQFAKSASSTRLNFVVKKDFDLINAFGKSTIDLVFSQAAFEHFDDIDSTIRQISIVCKSGAILVAEIDLKTHTRWIREKDPNNIYRYPKWFYNIFWFRGAPNRIRPMTYKDSLQRSGWTDINVIPLTVIDDHHISNRGLNSNFMNPKNEMKYLSVMICARKS